jgi:energy-coupling factor transporter ATP-binding protein EcfA2
VTTNERETKGSRVKLLPHQRALVETVLNSTSKRITLLSGDVGSGKTTALVALAGRLLQEQPTARALILVRAAVQRQFVERLREDGTPTLLVDRYQFREMLDSATKGETWPGGVVAVLSRDFAMQPDINESLSRTHWDLLIADEAHNFRGNAAKLLDQVGASAERFVLVTAMLSDLKHTHAFSTENATIVEWQRNQIVDHGGRLLDTAPQPIFHQVAFNLTPTELALHEKMKHLCNVLEAATQPRGLISNALQPRLKSSPPAVESILRTIAPRILAIGELTQQHEITEDVDFEEEIKFRFDPANVDETSTLIGSVLEQLDKMTVDSKLDAVGKLLSRITATKNSSKRVCILTDYFATLWYLSAYFEGESTDNVLLYGEMTVQDSHRSLTAFANGEGVLIATRAAITEEVDLSETTDLVLYDDPDNNKLLQEMLARFEKIDRRRQLNVHVLVPSVERKAS